MFFFLIPLVISIGLSTAALTHSSLPFALLGFMFSLIATAFYLLDRQVQKADAARWNQLAKEARHVSHR